MRKKQKKSRGPAPVKETGFVLTVFGIVTVCAFFLPAKAWILLLGAVLIVSGIVLL